MLTHVRDHLSGFLSDPGNNYVFVWICTIFMGALSLLLWLLVPGFAVAGVCLAIYLSLECWRWYYSDWVENCLYSQPREVIGFRAIAVNLRIAVCGAAAGILVFAVAGLVLGRDLTSTGLIMVYLLWLVAIPLSFASKTVKRFLVAALREVCGIPFNLAFFLMGLFSPEYLLDSRYKRVNAVAKKLFSALTGYSSNLTLLHDTDDIMHSLPTRK